MDARRIEVEHILPVDTPTIRIRTRFTLRLRRALRHARRVLGATLRAIRGIFPRRAYLTLE